MKTHARLMFWALQILWGLKDIWPTDRLRLWKKTINLYLSFLAFTDKDRPTEQLREAMICAFTSAVYDYDSDWVYGERTGTHCIQLLEQYVASDRARELAIKIYRTKESGGLSVDGLERGGWALLFYREVIGSSWLARYTDDEIEVFGCELQIIDDLLDFESDRVKGHKNCFADPDRSNHHATRAQCFLASEFFILLKENSRVYGVIENKAREALRQFDSTGGTFKQLYATGRPSTGYYALLLTIISFGFYSEALWTVRLVTAFAYAGLTMSIMVFNDGKDKENDRKRGKVFAHRHSQELLRYWWKLNSITALLVGIVTWFDPWTGLYCAAVWVVGLGYSYVPHWFIVNNTLVALCSGSPALVGAVYHRYLTPEAFMTFLMFSLLILWNEVYKDTEDMKFDVDYKATLPVRIGHTRTFLLLLGWFVIPAGTLALHPNPWVVRVGMVMMPIIAFQQAVVLLKQRWIGRCKISMRLTLQLLLITLLFT